MKRNRNAGLRLGLLAALLLACCDLGTAAAQVTVSAPPPKVGVASLEDQLVSRLHAASDSQRAFLRRVAVLVRQGKLEQRLVVAISHYALRRHAQLPFPFFERAMRFEAAKRGVDLPPVALVAHSASAIRDARH